MERMLEVFNWRYLLLDHHDLLHALSTSQNSNHGAGFWFLEIRNSHKDLDLGRKGVLISQLCYFYFGSLFNGISNLEGYLMRKASL